MKHEELLNALPDLLGETLPIRYGQKLYVVSCRAPHHYGNATKTLHVTCPVCGDTGVVIHNGYELKCSYCRDNARNAENRLELVDYKIHEYIVNELDIRLRGEEKKGGYGNDGFDMPWISCKAKAFYKYGRSYEDVMNIDVPKDIMEEGVRDRDSLRTSIDRRALFVFYNKEAAEETLNQIQMIQQEKLDAFNDKFGTNHPYPFPLVQEGEK